MSSTEKALAPNEQFRLDQCEKAIERGLNTFVEVGQALTEIRDGKLYRVGFKTFEAYCKDRWEIGRSRAYELIDQAKVVTAISDAGVNLSGAPDISSREVRAVKDDLPSVAAEVKARVQRGEEPAKAVATVVKEVAQRAKTEKSSEQAQHDATRRQTQEALSPEVKAIQARREEAKQAKSRPADEQLKARVDELEESQSILERDHAAVIAENKKFEAMRVLYEKGGFEAVIAAKDEEIRVLQGRVYSESAGKAEWMRKAEFWKKQAKQLGWRDTRFDAKPEADDDDFLAAVSEAEG